MARSGSTRPTRHRARQGNGLLQKLTSSTHLAGYVRRLPAQAVKRLIDEVGLEDSHEIVALLGPQKMQAVLSSALWSSDRPGQEEIFDLDELARWLDLWMSDGEQTLARRVLELSEDFVVMCLTKLVTVFDRTLVGVEDNGLEIGHYLVFPREAKHWQRSVAMLTILWHHEPDFVLHALRRCTFERSVLNDDIREHDDSGVFYEDVAAARAIERQSTGYVNPTHASMFLMAAKTSQLEDLCNARLQDPQAAEYLREHMENGDQSDELADETADEEVHPAHDRAEAREAFATLDALLLSAGVLTDSSPAIALLTDQRTAPPRSELLEGTLDWLAREATELASQRLRELAFLSNVLIAGTQIQGKTFGEKTAATVAMATANLGLDYLLFVRGSISSDIPLAAQLLSEDPGAIRLFQIGYHLLCTLPERSARAVYRAKDATARRPGRLLLREMDELLGSQFLSDRIAEGAYGEAKAIIDGLAAVMDSAACVALRRLIDPLPCFPRVLDPDVSGEMVYVDKGYRHIATMADLKTIAEFLDALPSYYGD